MSSWSVISDQSLQTTVVWCVSDICLAISDLSQVILAISFLQHMSLAHHVESGGFKNPWPPKASLLKSITTILRVPVTPAHSFEVSLEPATTIPCNFNFDTAQALKGSKFLNATWLGHAVCIICSKVRRILLLMPLYQGFYLELPQINASPPIHIVFDPIFAERASPSAWIGPRRYLPPPCEVGDLPAVHFVVISHNQYVSISPT